MTTIEEYKQFVNRLALMKDSRVFLNSDNQHALIVLIQIFNTAKSIVRIYAGCLSNVVGDNPEYIKALSEFIERGGEVHIMLNKYNEDSAKKSDLYKRLAYYQSINKPVVVKTTTKQAMRTDKSGTRTPIHFTVGDTSCYRIETDIEKRSAECSMNDETNSTALVNFFDVLFKQSDVKDLKLVDLFSNNDD